METKKDKPMKIAKIINEFTFIITGGIENGLQVDDELSVLQDKSIEVVDPDTGEMIGKYHVNKGTIFVEEVYQNFSLCRSGTYEDEVPVSPFSATTRMSNFISGTKTVTKYKKLQVNTDEITGGLSTDPISIGDIVKKVLS